MAEFTGLLTADSLTRIVFLPALLCLPLLFMRRASAAAVKSYALGASLVELGVTIYYVAARWTAGGFAPVSDPTLAWIPSLGIRYAVGLDGISMPLVVLTALLLPVVVLGSWKGIEEHWQGFAISLLLLTTGILGALVATDLFLFYIFWEVMLIPMYLLIGIWGGQRRIYAAVKFFLFTMAGSLLMLLGIVWLGWTFRQISGSWSFAYADLLRLDLPLAQQTWLFAAFALAFAIKVPMFPLHTWLPDAHVEAPTGGSVILAGIMLKLGTYGFLRFALPLFPHAAHRAMPLLLGLAVTGILYGALVSWMQSDMKKLIAYSSVAHLGFVMLGLLAFDIVAWQGALLQMVNHGLSTGALFLLVGMIYDRRHTKEFAAFGGLAKVMPWFAFFLVFATLASVGLPALNGFAGEFLILAGAFKSQAADLRWLVVASTFGVVLAAVYLLKMLQLTLWGPLVHEENKQLSDLDGREKWLLAPLCALMLWIGVAPRTFLEPSQGALEALLRDHQSRGAPAAVSAVALRPAPAAPSAALGLGAADSRPETQAAR
jgi:NADH-quinone oxidoreductase subunit M